MPLAKPEVKLSGSNYQWGWLLGTCVTWIQNTNNG